MAKKLSVVLSMLMIFSMLLSACGAPTAAPTAAPTEEQPVATEEVAATEEAPAATEEPSTNPNAVEIRWFIGLGAGGNTEEVEKEEAFVALFNEKYGDRYHLVLDVVQNTTAYDVLKTQIASGDAPDIVGPVGVRGIYSFEGAWLDLTPYIEKYNYDLEDFNPTLVKFYQFENQGQVGLPFAVYPSALWYNKDLFDEAGLEYPPHEWGAPYADGDEWTYEKLQELAIELTVDADGNTPNDKEFDPENIQQFGYHPLWTDIRGQWTFFGASSFVGDDGNAAMPEVWREAAHWYYDGIWKYHFIPNDNYVNSDLLAQGNTFSSGKVAMSPIHTWYTCCAAETSWDVAAIPSYNDNLTAKMHADTFVIPAAAKNKEAAFEVLSLMLGEFAPDLLSVYNGFPARASLQDKALASMAEKFPEADLNVFVDALSYADIPNHESGMPNFLKASDRYTTFGSLYQSTPDLDLDKEIDTLIKDLDLIFKETDK